MSSPEDKQKHSKRIKIRSKIARELEDRKFRQRVREDKRKKADLTTLTHKQLVDLIQEEDLDGDDRTGK